MNRLRRVAGLAVALVVAASLLGSTPTAAARSATLQSEASAQSDDAARGGSGGTPEAFHEAAVRALEKLDEIDFFDGTGCADGEGLCADEALPRWEMAVWLARIVDRAEPAPSSTSRYSDVEASAWWAPHAELVAFRAIDPGCAERPLRFCADRAVTRGEAAGLVARAFSLAAADRAGFADVDDEHPDAADIDRLAAARVTGGCDTEPARFCPDQPVSRAQMALLLARAAGLVEPATAVEPAYEPAVDDTLLPVDPAVTIGTLDNGLTYYLRHNDSPGKNLAVRLLVNVGSVDETDREVGIGHFVEHMLFNGTTDYPGNSLGEALREIGVELGPDINAHVGHDETVYEIEVRLDGPDRAPLVFHALSQMAAEATFTAEAVDAERGVVLDELRFSREAVDGFIGSEFDRVYTQGTPYEGRDPAGTPRSVNTMTPADLRAFYEKWYVPANMAVVVVGDMDTADMEALVEEHFAPLTAGEGRQAPSVDIALAPSSSHVVTDPRQGVTFISLDIPIAVHDLSTVGGDRLATMESVIAIMVQNRLDDAYHRGELSQVDPPSFITFTYNRGLRYYGTNWQGDNLDTASRDYFSVLLTAQEHGFTEGDLHRAVSQVTAGLEFALDSVGTIQDGQWAGLYGSHFFYGADIDTIEQSVNRTAALLAEFTPEELTDHFRWQMYRGGLLAIAVGPDPASVPTVSELDAALRAAAPGPPPPEVTVIERLMDPPEPVDATDEGVFDVGEDGQEWSFANGATVMFAPSEIAEGVVNVHAESLGGWSLLEPGDRALSAIAVNAVAGSGLGEVSRAELNRLLEDRNVSLSPYIGESAEGFVGSSSIADIETLFQLLHLLVTAPRIDEQAYVDALHSADTRLALAERDPRWQAAIAYLEARYGDTWHRAIASRDEIDSLTPQGLLAMYQSRLGSVDDLTVAVVGDIDAAEIERLARLYIATLPAGDPDTYINRRPAMPAGEVQRQVQVGAGESAVLEFYFEADMAVDASTVAASDVLRAALSERLFLAIREELGSSYVAGAGIGRSRLPSETFDSTVFATLDPARFDEIRARVLDIVADVASNGISAQEFTQAAAIVETSYARARNSDLIAALLTRRLVDDDAEVITLHRLAEELASLTPADVQALAAALYGEGGRIEVVRRP